MFPLTPHLGNYFPQSSSLPIWDTDKAQKLGLGVKKKKKGEREKGRKEEVNQGRDHV